MTPWDIDWIVERAAQRGYPIPAAFMSSKQGAGINHKQYGVTSEGVVVYLDVALRRVLNINPNTDSFSVKITGGPDGDVSCNCFFLIIFSCALSCVCAMVLVIGASVNCGFLVVVFDMIKASFFISFL